MKIKVKEKFVDSISGKKIYANKAENTTNGLNIDDSIYSLSSTIKTKQDKLTFSGENNTITAINSSAIGGGGSNYTAGTDLEIVNNVIGIRTNDCTSNSAEYAFVEGSKNSATGYYSHAEGNSTSADGNASHTEGIGTIISTKGGHAGGLYNKTSSDALFVIGNGSADNARSDAFIVDITGKVSAAGNMFTSAGQVVTDVMLTSATNGTTSFVTNGIADLTPLYTYIKSLEDRIAALEAAQGGITVNGIQPTVNGNTITVGE